MPTQLLDPHKFDAKDKTPSTGTDAELHALIVDMLKAGHSEDEVRKFVQKVDDLKDPTSARVAGVMQGIGPGLLTGLIGIPMMVKDAVLDGISMLQGKDPENAKAFIDSVHTFLPKLREAGPREQAQMVTELATSFGTGAAMGGGTFAARKPIAKGMGTVLLKAAEHPQGVRLTSGSAMLGGMVTGNLPLATAGAAGTLVPDVAENIGRKLYKYGSGAEYVSPKQAAATAAADASRAKGLTKLDDIWKSSMSTRNGTFFDEQQAAALEARKAATVEAAKTGLEPGVPSVRTSLSAKDSNGGRTSVSQSFKAPSAENRTPVPAGLTPDEESLFRSIKNSPDGAQIPDAVIVQGIRGPKANPVASVAPAGRPAIRVAEPAPAAAAPVERRKIVGSKSTKLQEVSEGTDSLEELMNALHGEDSVLPGNGSGGATALAERPRTSLSAAKKLRDHLEGMPESMPDHPGHAEWAKQHDAVDEAITTLDPGFLDLPPRSTAVKAPENYMTDADVANIGEHANAMGDQTLQTLRKAGADVPEGGLQTSQDVDRVVATTPTTPKNLHMGSDATAKEIAADVRVRAQGGGGIRIDGSRPGEPISLVKGKPLPLNDEAQKVLQQYLTENPEVDAVEAEAHLRKLIGGDK